MLRSAVLPRVLCVLGLAAIAGCGGGTSGKPRGVPERRQALAVGAGEREGDRGEKAGAETGGPATELVGDRAWPRSYVETKRALAARSAMRSHPQRLSKSDFRQPANANLAAASITTPWEQLGPVTPNVPDVVTYTGRATTNSGRVTALALAPTCVATNCRLWVAAAGGGVWRTDDALATPVVWTAVSNGLTSNAIGSLALDPNDGTHHTIYAGTGEPNGSGDSEAGVGLFKSSDSGDHWSLVPGSTTGVATDRSIGAIAIDPTDANHIFIGTDLARHGSSSVNGGRRTPPNAPTLGVYESSDGGNSFTLKFSKPANSADPAAGSDWFQGGVNRLEFDPNHASVIYAALFGYGIWRLGDTHDTDTTSFHQVFATKFPEDAPLAANRDTFGDRTEFALADVSGTPDTTRIYAGDSSDDNGYAQLFSVDDADTVSSTTLVGAGLDNAGWTGLSDTAPPGSTSNGYCQNGQCGYDSFVAVEPDAPDDVWLGGSMNYDDLGGGPSNGRAVVRSTDAGVTFRDMTNDTQTPPLGMHPDQHAIALTAGGGNPIAFVGSDGGVVRVKGPYTGDQSARCSAAPPGLNLTGAALTTCQDLLTNIPTTIESLDDGLATLQFQSLSVDAAGDILGGTQDNGTWSTSGAATSWQESVGGDGGQSAFDSGNASIRLHTYFGSSGDVNFNGADPLGWTYVTGPLDATSDATTGTESVSFYMPLIADPAVAGTVFAGMGHVWRTKDDGGAQSQLEAAHCGEQDPVLAPDPLACGDWVPLGADLTSTAFGTDRAGQYVVALARAPGDSATLWAATRTGRLLVSNNASAAAGSVAFDRIDTAATPGRFVSGIVVDPSDPRHAWISYSGYSAYTPSTPQHVLEARYDPSTATATFTDRSYDLGDVPLTGLAAESGDLYAATDFGVLRLPAGATAWEQVGTGLPPVAVYGLTMQPGSHTLYAATHGRGAWRIAVPFVTPSSPPAETPPATTTTPTSTTPTSTTPTSTTPTSTTPTSPPVVVLVARAPTLLGHTVHRRQGVIRVALRCPAATGRCSGRLELRAPRRGGGSVLLGHKRYSIAQGRKAHVAVRVPSARFAHVKRGSRLRLTVRVLRTHARKMLVIGHLTLVRAG